MEMRCRPTVMCCSVFAMLCATMVPRSAGLSYGDRQYLNEWAVEVPGGLRAADTIAKELDYELVRQVG
jgi:proprotein convertase subtilisin/kexin type 1